MKDKLVNCFFQSSILITSTPWIMEQYLISRFHKFCNVHVEFIFQWEAYLHWWGKELLPRDQSWHPSISRPPKGGIISAREKDKTGRCPHHSSLSFRIKEEEQCHQESWAGSEKLCLQDKLKPIVKILYIFKRNSFMENKKVLNDSWINR